jgi:hypothetical protein
MKKVLILIFAILGMMACNEKSEIEEKATTDSISAPPPPPGCQISCPFGDCSATGSNASCECSWGSPKCCNSCGATPKIANINLAFTFLNGLQDPKAASAAISLNNYKDALISEDYAAAEISRELYIEFVEEMTSANKTTYSDFLSSLDTE